MLKRSCADAATGSNNAANNVAFKNVLLIVLRNYENVSDLENLGKWLIFGIQ